MKNDSVHTTQRKPGKLGKNLEKLKDQGKHRKVLDISGTKKHLWKIQGKCLHLLSTCSYCKNACFLIQPYLVKQQKFRENSGKEYKAAVNPTSSHKLENFCNFFFFFFFISLSDTNSLVKLLFFHFRVTNSNLKNKKFHFEQLTQQLNSYFSTIESLTRS